LWWGSTHQRPRKTDIVERKQNENKTLGLDCMCFMIYVIDLFDLNNIRPLTYIAV